MSEKAGKARALLAFAELCGSQRKGVTRSRLASGSDDGASRMRLRTVFLIEDGHVLAPVFQTGGFEGGILWTA